MSGPDLEPLDDDLADLLGAERERPPASPDVPARVLRRVMATVGTGGGGSPPPDAGPPGAGFGGLAKPVLLGAVLGGMVSAVLLTRPEPAEAPPPAVTAKAEAAAVAAPSPPPAERAGPVASERPSVSPPAATTPASAAGHDESLAAERRVLDEALRALADGRGAAAMEALERHASAFPRGRLTEEREGLWIRALARAGRADEARARAARFRESYPRSILLPAIESSVGAIP